MKFHYFSKILMKFHYFSEMLMKFHYFSEILVKFQCWALLQLPTGQLGPQLDY